MQFADAAHRYRLDSRIATGGMGVVWRATDTRLNREVAVKVLKHEYVDDPTFRTRFETEARHAASLHHPGIAGVFDYQADPSGLGEGGAPYLVMEYVDGAPLSALLAQAKADGRRLDPDVVRDLMGQTAAALGVAHAAGIVHRDVKPANLLVTPDGQVKVTDFGIARAGDAAQITRTGAVMGTPQYLSPEQARGNASTPASDVYALGVVTFECLVGRRPFEADTPVATALAHLQQPVPELPADVPADLAAVVRRAMAKSPEERFTDGAAFAQALRDPSAAAAAGAGTLGPETAATAVIPGVAAAVAGAAATGITTPPPDRPEPAAPYAGDGEDRRRSPWPAILLVLLLVAIAVLIAFLFLGGDDETPSDDTTSSETDDRKKGGTIVLDEDDFEGREVDVVEAELKELGLEVTLDMVENDGSGTEGIVTGIDPSGRVEKGALITVSYYGAPPETETPDSPDPSDTPDDPDTPDSTPTTEPSDTATSETSDPPETTQTPDTPDTPESSGSQLEGSP